MTNPLAEQVDVTDDTARELTQANASQPVKRVFDILVASAGLIISAPLLLGIAVLIKLDSVGPVFYRGVRIGQFGHPFRIFKFRTMTVNADILGGTSTGKNDPRVTRVGKDLRRLKLDELPQLINVVKGEMSIVGPRPEVEEYTRLYHGEETIILSVRPGITDYASLEFINLTEVLGEEDVDRVYAEKVRPIKNNLRVKYVKEHTICGDMKILLKTVWQILKLFGRRSWST
jgi:lipopolysaccharide/colanic/teichoic acid biosynthesis glycosyltransferase